MASRLVDAAGGVDLKGMCEGLSKLAEGTLFHVHEREVPAALVCQRIEDLNGRSKRVEAARAVLATELKARDEVLAEVTPLVKGVRAALRVKYGPQNPKLRDFGVEVHVVAASPGPVITRYEIEPATGVNG